MNRPKYFWPDIFDPQKRETLSDDEVLADALMAWGNVLMGEVRPDFGETMAWASNKLGVSGTPGSFKELADRRFAK